MIGRTLLRVQCKWAPRQGEVVFIRCYSCRRARDGMRVRRYTAAEIDGYAAYCAETDRCYYLPIASFGDRRAIQFRLAPTRNNQRSGVHWASEYEFAATIGEQLLLRGHSSAGRASGWQPEGRRFEPGWLH